MPVFDEVLDLQDENNELRKFLRELREALNQSLHDGLDPIETCEWIKKIDSHL